MRWFLLDEYKELTLRFTCNNLGWNACFVIFHFDTQKLHFFACGNKPAVHCYKDFVGTKCSFLQFYS